MEEVMTRTTVGLFVGLILGLALVVDGFGSMLIVGLFGAIGYVVMKVVEGELDLTRYLGGRQEGSKFQSSTRRRV
jgi:hypothetical protein